MYAIFEDGSHQHKVSEGEVVRVDFRRGEGDEFQGVPVGTRIEFANVLLYSNGGDLQIGQPAIAGMRVVGEVVDHPSVKTYIQKFRRRKHYRRMRGHRQHWTAVRIRHILLPGQQAPAQQQQAPAQESAAPAPQN